MSLLNPLGVTGPNSPGNYVQTDFRNPSVNANVANYPVGANMLNLTWPLTRYVQNDEHNSFHPVDAGVAVFYPQNLNAMAVSNNP